MFVVTGANGFIGSAMIWELNRHGHTHILAVDRVDLQERPELLKPLQYQNFLTADEFLQLMESPSAPSSSTHAKAVSLQDVKAIFHMGACSSTTETNVEFLRENNTEYTQKLFRAATEHRWPFFYASSGAVYGNGKAGFDDELPSDTWTPLNPYGWSKLNFDIWAEQQTLTPPRWYGLRFFNVFGPHEYHKGPMSSVVYKAVQQIQQKGFLNLFRSHHPDYRDGHQRRDFVYVKDLTSWMWQIYSRPLVRSGIYNMGSGQARTWLDLAQAVFTNLKVPLQINWIDIPDEIRGQYQYFTEAKMNKLYKEGLPAPSWTLESGVADYIHHYLLQPFPYLNLNFNLKSS